MFPRKFDIFKAARSIDWAKPVNSMAFYDNIFIIFQNQSVVTLTCSKGEWKENLHKNIAEIYPNIAKHAPFDAVYIERTAYELSVEHWALLFKKNVFFRCPTIGNDVGVESIFSKLLINLKLVFQLCEGPYSIEEEYFSLKGYCWYSTPHIDLVIKNMLRAFVIIAVVLLLFIVFMMVRCSFSPFNFTYFVSNKMGPDSNPGLSYEALKIQSENNGTHQALASVDNDEPNPQDPDQDGLVYKVRNDHRVCLEKNLLINIFDFLANHRICVI